MQGLAGNLSDLTVESSRYDKLLCSETLVPEMHQVSELLVPGYGHPVLLCQGRMPQARGMLAYVREGTEHFINKSLSVGIVNCWFLGSGV